MSGSAMRLQEENPRSVVAAALWSARWVLLAAVLAAGIGGYFASSSRDPQYSATSRVFFSVAQNFDALGSQAFGDFTRFGSSQAAVLTSRPVLTRAARALGGDETAEELDRAVSVAVSDEAEVLTVTTTGSSPREAARRADQVVDSYKAYAAEQVSESAAAAVAATDDVVVDGQILARAAIYGSGVQFEEDAVAGSRPTSPKPLRDAGLLAGVAGLVVAGWALLRRPLGSAALPPWVEGRTLATVSLGRGQRPVVDATDQAQALVALDYARNGSSGPVLVTGLSQTSGSAPVAHGLALAAAAQGRRVLLVDAEPGRRELLVRTGVTAPAVHLDALGVGEPVTDVLVDAPTGDAEGPQIVVAILGAREEQPVRGPDLRAALDGLRGSFDLIIVQSAPVQQSALAFALLGFVEAVVVTIGVDERTDDLSELDSRLAATGRAVTGVIRTRRTRREVQFPLSVTSRRRLAPASSPAAASPPAAG